MEQASLLHPDYPLAYHLGEGKRILVLSGLTIGMVFGVACITVGQLIQSHALPISASRYNGDNLHFNLNPPIFREILLLLFNLTFVKLSVWSSSKAHETALKWKLASEDDKQTRDPRLEFNANLRFLQSSYEWWSANGVPANVMMALCLTISYASSSMVLLSVQQKDGAYDVIVPFVVLYILGATTLLQCAIAFYAIFTTKIPTWSSSPFDTAAVLFKEGHLRRTPGRCMYSIFDRFKHGPVKPRVRQESAFVSHPYVRGLVMYIWLLVAAGYYWAFIIWGMMDSGTQGSHRGNSWAPIPWTASNSSLSSQSMSNGTGSMDFGWNGEAPIVGLLWGLGILVGFQGGIVTTATTCADTLVALACDEQLWREAGTEQGSDPSPGFIKAIFIRWYSTTTFIAEPFLNWLFGLAVSVDADVGFQIRPVQILYVAIVGTAGAIAITVAAKYRSHTTQPSTYGHLQTLVNLIDEWHCEMFWGHKSDGHAGTSNHRLPPVDIDSEYGSGKKIC